MRKPFSFFLLVLFIFAFSACKDKKDVPAPEVVPSSPPQEPVGFSCEIKRNYAAEVRCQGKRTVENQTELENFLLYLSTNPELVPDLEIKFDLNVGELDIHTPCQIQVMKKKNLTALKLCLDGREGVLLEEEVQTNIQEIFAALSERGAVEFRKEAKIRAGELLLRGRKKSEIGQFSRLEVSGPILLENADQFAGHISQIEHDSIIIAGALTLKSMHLARLGQKSAAKIQGDVLILALANDSGSQALIHQGTNLSAKKVHLESPGVARIGAKVQLTASGPVSIFSTGDFLESEAIVDQKAIVKALHVNIQSQNIGTLVSGSRFEVVRHFNMDAQVCRIDVPPTDDDDRQNRNKTVTIIAQTKTGSCFNNPNDTPVAYDLNVLTPRNTPVTFTIPQSQDLDGDILEYLLVSPPSLGTLSGCLNGVDERTCTYTPPQNFLGEVAITYQTYDGIAKSNIATIRIKVNTPPEMLGNQSFETDEDLDFSFQLFGGTDLENDPLTYKILTPPSKGQVIGCLGNTSDLTCTYVPNPDANGEDSFTYVANDGGEDAAIPATVTITINPIPDPPVMLSNQSFQAQEDLPLVFTLAGGIDADGDTLNYALLSYPSSGRLENCARGDQVLTCTYFPEQNFSGTVSFTYKANDGQFDTAASSTVTIEVLSVNDNPTLPPAQQVVVLKNTTDQFSVGQGLDIDSPGLTYELVTPPARGILENCLNSNNDLSCQYTPANDDTASVTFAYRAFDGQGYSALSNVTIVINTPPVAVLEANIFSGEAPLTVQFSALNSTDSDGSVRFQEWSFGNGTTGNGAEVLYTFTEPGIYQIMLTVTDDSNAANTALVTITVIHANATPVANFTTSASSGQAPLFVQFNGNISTDDQGIVLYEWDFAGLGSAQGALVDFTFTQNGDYAVILKVTDAQGLQHTLTRTIIVKTLPCFGAFGSIHTNGGGFVAATALAEANVFVGPEAQVCDQSQVTEFVRLEDRALIKDNALVSGTTTVKNTARIYGQAQVSGDSIIYGQSEISGDSVVVHGEIYDNAKVYGRAKLTGTGQITDPDTDVVVDDPRDPGTIGRGSDFPFLPKILKSNIGRVNVYGQAEVFEDAFINDNSHILGNAKVYGGAIITRSVVTDQAEVFDYAQVLASEVNISFIGGTAKVREYAQILGSSIFENALIKGNTQVSDGLSTRSLIYGNASIEEFAQLTESEVFEDARVFGNAQIINQSKIHGTAQVDYFVDGQDISSK